MSCPVHYQRPLFSLADHRLNLQCCCNEFKIICLNKAVKFLTDYKNTLPSRSPDGV
jgi:hypothetical protein